jgi:predicted DsbA family dithiol-disulfide isomerase
MNRNMRAIPEGWVTCAKNAGIEVADVRSCVEGQEGTGLLRYSFHKSRDRRVSGSPTMFINQKKYNGGRSERAFTFAICGAFTGKKPKLCTSIPPPPKVEILILSDKRCKDCQSERLAEGVGGLFYGSKVKVVDYSTKLGRKLYALVKPEKLPIIFFNREAKKADNYDRIQFRIKEVGKYLVMSGGGRFDPTKEVCDNRVDDTGNGKVDCQDPDCKETLICREEIPGQLEVFIMSQCPYCSKGMEAMRDLLERFGDEMKFKIHYIATETRDGFRALHGQSEVDENIRGLCVMKYYPEPGQFMKYFWCRMEDIRSEKWIPCTGENGIDTTMVEMCFTGGEGANLLRQDIKIAEALGIMGSPTWLANNRHKFNGIHVNVILENFCKHNQKLKGCQGVGTK